MAGWVSTPPSSSDSTDKTRRPTSTASALGRPSTVASTDHHREGSGSAGAGGAGMSGARGCASSVHDNLERPRLGRGQQ
eukprot:4859774-Prymnesium_polylepis.1